MATARKTPTEPERDEFDFAPAWQPEPGDILRGKVKQLDMGYSDYGPYPIVTVTSSDPADDGDYAIHCFHEALRNKLTDLKPAEGDEIAIKFFGETAAKDGKRKYMKYGVKMEGGPRDFWGEKTAKPNADPEPITDDEDIPF